MGDLREILEDVARRSATRPCWRLSDYARAELLKYRPCECVDCRPKGPAVDDDP